MIPFFNIPNLTEIFHFPKVIQSSLENKHEKAIFNRDYRNIILSQPLEISITNLRQIQGRVLSRINKETDNGIDMASTTELYDIADQAIGRAELALSLATSTPTTVSGTHPLFTNTRFAIEEAKKALSDVIDSLSDATTTATSTEDLLK